MRVRSTSTVDPLVFSLLVDVMEIAKHFYRANVRTSIINNPFAAVLDNVFEKLECFVDLPPLAGFLFHKSTVDAGHDFVEVLAISSNQAGG